MTAEEKHTEQLDPQKVKEGYWLIDNTTYIKAQKTELKKGKLLLKNLVVLTVHGQKATGALFQGSFQVSLPKEAKL